jgi:HD-like signal output (HDOD) protein
VVQPSAAPQLDRDDITARLQRTFSSPSYKPPVLPAAAAEIMQLAQRPDVTFEKVAPVLERDPVLTARVVSVAQSAAYSSRSPILTLHQAAVRLGVKGVRDLVLEAALHLKVFRAPGHDQAMARLARHSSATAHVIRVVCGRTRVEAEHAFLCGLLHDVGFAACTMALSEDPGLRRTPFEALAAVLDEAHAPASALLTRAWGLPASIQQLVATHHDVVIKGRSEPLNAALIVAEQLVWEAGAGLEPPPPDASPLATQMPEPPIEGLDVNWTGVVEQAREALRLDTLTFCALRAEAFEVVRRTGAR